MLNYVFSHTYIEHNKVNFLHFILRTCPDLFLIYLYLGVSQHNLINHHKVIKI